MSKTDAYSKLRELRKSRGLTVNNLADKIGEDYQKVGRVERGQTSLTVDYLVKLSRGLKVPIDEILGEEQASEAPKHEDGQALLGYIVTAVDERLSGVIESRKKGSLVSNIYDLVLKLPEETHQTVVKAIVEITYNLESA